MIAGALVSHLAIARATLQAQRVAEPAALTSVAAPPTMPSFAVRDQFDRLLTRAALAGTRVLFLVADRDGADAAARWYGALRGPAAARGVRVVRVADLQGAPRLLHGVIRRAFPKDTADAILLDFAGPLGRALRGERASLVAVLYDADGRLTRAVALPLGTAPDASTGVRLLDTPHG